MCNSKAIAEIVKLNHVNPRLTLFKMHYFLCDACGCVFQGAPTFLDQDHYETSYYNNPIRMASLTETMRLLEKYHPPSNGNTALDVGCGNGNLMLLMREQGFDASGVELSVSARREAGNRGFTVFSSRQSVATNRYDLLVFNHVLEHVANPKKFIASFLPLVKEYGCVYVEVPSVGLLASGSACSYNNLYPNHIHHFSADGLVGMLGRQGCSVIAVEHHNMFSYPSLMCMFQKARPGQSGRVRFESHCRHEDDIPRNAARLLREHAASVEHVVIWGCSSEAYHVLRFLDDTVLDKTILVDSSAEKIGKFLYSREIRPPESADGLDNVLFFCAPTSIQVLNSIKNAIEVKFTGKRYSILFNHRVHPFVASRRRASSR